MAAEFLHLLCGTRILALHCKLHASLTDNGIQFTYCKPDWSAKAHSFACICRVQGINQRLTQVDPHRSKSLQPADKEPSACR